MEQLLQEAVSVEVVAAETAEVLVDLDIPEPCCSCYRCYTGW